jgi:hypothetical protein
MTSENEIIALCTLLAFLNLKNVLTLKKDPAFCQV